MSDKKRQMQEAYYKKAAEVFDRNRMNSNHQYKIKEIGKELMTNIPKNEVTILELGCGTGLHACEFMNNYGTRIKSMTLSDLSNEMLEKAKTRMEKFGDRVKFFQSPAEEFFIQDKFAGIYISGSMHHFSNYETSIKNVKRNLDRDGIIVICEPIIQNPCNLVKALFVKEEWGQFKVTRRNVEKSLNKHGFEIINNRVLHYKSNNPKLRKLLELENKKVFDWMAVMFLITARKRKDD